MYLHSIVSVCRGCVCVCVCVCVCMCVCVCVGGAIDHALPLMYPTPPSIPTQKDSTKSTAQFPFKIARVSSSDRVIQAALSMETMPAAHNQGAVVETPQMKRLYEKLEDLVSGWKNTAFQVFKVANFIFSIIAMMVSYSIALVMPVCCR